MPKGDVAGRVGASLREFRQSVCRERGVTRDEFYGAVGVGHNTGYRWEAGDHEPPFDRLDALLRHWGGEMLVVFGGDAPAVGAVTDSGPGAEVVAGGHG